MFFKSLLVALGGAFGAVARYLVGGWIAAIDSVFPVGTLVINISGSFLLGFLYVLALERFLVSSEWRLVLATGFLGAYTTFSTFSYETLKLVEDGAILAATLNVSLSIVGGLLAVYLGTVTARLI